MAPPDIFDRRTRRCRFDRIAANAAENRWLTARMADEIVARLATVKRSFSRALIIGVNDARLEATLQSMAVEYLRASPGQTSASDIHCDEDRLPFADESFDLVISIGSLDSVNDVPGALVLIRRILKPDGLFLGAMIGVDSIPLLKSISQGIEPGVSRVHPLIDVRSAGDLLARAGFAMPVADVDSVVVHYAKFHTLIADLRANTLSNCLVTRPQMKRSWLNEAQRRFGQSDQIETFSIIFMSGWKPLPAAVPQTSASRRPISGRSAGGISIE